MGIEKINLEALQPYIENKTVRTEKTGIKKLDEFLRFKRNLLIIGGLANVGKTTGTLWLMFTWSRLLKSSPRWLVFSNENENAESKVMLMEWFHELPIYNQSPSQIKSALEWVDSHFQFLANNYSIELKDVFRDAGDTKKNIWDFDGLLVDPYSSLNQGTYKDHYQNATWMREWVVKYESKLIVTMHAGTDAARLTGRDGNPAIPMPAHLEMGTMWQNRADDMIIMHRNIQDEKNRNVFQVHVVKTKQIRTGGKTTNKDSPIELFFQEKWGGFLWENDSV